jgi:DNA mismatch repair protein MutL
VGRIRVLESWLADRIAAGEVVERPASVVKELVENALDAGARRVTVEFAGGGFELVRVADDGEGMDPEDARLCLRRFATSKIASPDDLRRVTTLGFRGEALPSIAAVSHVEVLTSDGRQATRVRAEGGSEPVAEPAAAPRGTVVTVRHLFYNTPARRRFLRSLAREAALCLDAVERHALARPDVAFRVVRDGREVLVLPAEGARERTARVLGVDPDALLPVDVTAQRFRVWGFVGTPELARRSRSGQYVFANRRPVASALVSRAVDQGARTLVFTGHHPVCALFLELPPDALDPNVHPRKLEVRFADESRVFSLVERAVREAYRSRPLVRAVPVGPTASAGAPLRLEVRETAPAGLTEPRLRAPLPPLRLLGQLLRTYVLADSPEGLVVVDQHAAHERVLYERLVRDRTRGQAAQLLAVPASVELSAAEAAVLPELVAVLRQVGLDVEPFGGNTALVRSVPSAAGRASPEALLRACLQEGIWDGVSTAGREALERAASVVACHSAIRSGDPLSVEEMRALLEALEACEDPYTCFHGRPTLVVVPAERLEAWFLRR